MEIQLLSHSPQFEPISGIVINHLVVVEGEKKEIQNEVQGLCRKIHSSPSIDEAMGILSKEDVEVLIVDCDFAGPIQEDCLYTLLYQLEKPPTVVVVSSDERRLGEMIHYPAVIVIEKPLQLTNLLSSIPERVKKKIDSTVLQVEDYLQMLSFGHHSVRIQVELDPEGSGFIDLSEGRIVQAELGNTTGYQALKALILKPAKSIGLLPMPRGPITASKEFNDSIPALLLNIMTDLDESMATSEDFDPLFSLGSTEISEFESLLGRAMGAYLERSLDKAEVLFKQCLEIRPDDPRCRHNLELIRRKKGL